MLKSEITGTTFVHARGGQYGVMYSLQLSKKNKDDQWENGYINAQFKKGGAVAVCGGAGFDGTPQIVKLDKDGKCTFDLAYGEGIFVTPL